MNTGFPPFESSRLKIGRAKNHIEALDHAIRDYLGKGSLAIVHEADPNDPMNWSQCMHVREPVPPILSAIIGDVIHNLRASLDLLACDLVRLNNQSDKNVYFPFCENQAAYEKMIKERNMHRAAPQVVVLLKKLAPYKGGNEVLRAIHDLDISDKHRTLIPAIGMAGLIGLGVALLGPNGEQYPLWNLVKDRQVFACGRSTHYLTSGQEIPASFHLIFPFGGTLEGREVIPMLHCMIELVTGIVESFEALGLVRLNPSGVAP